MKKLLSNSAALWVSFSALALLGLLAWGCSGPQPLSVAMRRDDEQSYNKYLDQYKVSPRDAFFAWKASYTGTAAKTLAKTDEQISSTHNPFDAHRNPETVSRGAVIYKAHCLSCHGENVDGRGPSLLEPTPKLDFHSFGKRFAITLHRGAPKNWFKKINEGYTSEHVNVDNSHSSMPAFGDTLAREQIWLAITYLQTLDIHAENGGEQVSR